MCMEAKSEHVKYKNTKKIKNLLKPLDKLQKT